MMPCFTSERTISYFANPADFDEKERAVLARAAATWNEVVGAPDLLRLYRGYSATHSISKEPAEVSGGTALFGNYDHGRWRVTGRNITLSPKLRKMNLYNTILHEFGHAIGLDHGPGVMGGYLSVDVQGNPLPASRLKISESEGSELRVWVASWGAA